MLTQWLFNVFIVVLTYKEVISLDLLDEYVKHVEDTSKIIRNQVKSNYPVKRSVNPKFLHRHKRHLSNQVTDEINWTHSERLDYLGDVVLMWQPRHQEILFRVEARTRGYIGVGFSPNGGMEGADIILGWVDDRTNKAHLMDCHGVPKSQGSAPVRDEVDNYTLMRGIQNDSHTIIEFRRALDTCDPDDYILSSDTVRVIWALHDIDPHFDFEMIYHGDKRGSQSLHLLAPPPISKPDATSHVRHWDVTLQNVEIRQDMNTMYWCKIFKSPTLQQKHHIIGYEPMIGLNHSNYVHHMLLHECAIDQTDVNKWETYSREDGRACYSADMPMEWERCLTTLVAWAVGSKGENYPQHVGLPLNEKRNTFYMLEVHFDNPSMKKAVDTTGLRLHYTHKLRENDGGILVTGVALSSLHVIPPKQNEYRSAGYCSLDCTRKMLPRDGINVVSVLLHSHLAGRKLKLRHIRGDKELIPISQDNHYDFNFQQSRTLSHEIKILPGDGLVTECTYSTINRKKPTLGGYSTSEEMCLAFVLHYPKTELAGCFSMPPIKYFFETLGVQEFYGKNMNDIEKIFLQGGSDNVVTPPTTKAPLFRYKPGDENSPEANRRAILAIQNAKDYTIEGESSGGQSVLDKLIIKEPTEFQNKTFMAHLEDIPAESVLTQKIEEYFYKGLHLTFCRKKDDSLAIKEKVEKFPDFTPFSSNASIIQCSYRMRHTNSANKFTPNNVVASILLFAYIFLSR